MVINLWYQTLTFINYETNSTKCGSPTLRVSANWLIN
jgi:hypothetical protein